MLRDQALWVEWLHWIFILFHLKCAENLEIKPLGHTKTGLFLTSEPSLGLLYTFWDWGHALVFIFKIDLLSMTEAEKKPSGAACLCSVGEKGHGADFAGAQKCRALTAAAFRALWRYKGTSQPMATMKHDWGFSTVLTAVGWEKVFQGRSLIVTGREKIKVCFKKVWSE